MKTLLAVAVLSFATLWAAESDVRSVAIQGLSAVRDENAAALNELAHPDLKKRLRTSRLLLFYRERRNEPSDVSALSDAGIIAEFCDAHRSIVPKDERFERIDQYLRTELRGDYAIVTFYSGNRTKATGAVFGSEIDVVLRKEGNRWLFLWSPDLALHVDLEWDPRKDMPGQDLHSRPR